MVTLKGLNISNVLFKNFEKPFSKNTKVRMVHKLNNLIVVRFKKIVRGSFFSSFFEEWGEEMNNYKKSKWLSF